MQKLPYKIEHIGIAVNSIEESAKVYNFLLGEESYKEEIVETEGVRTVFFKIGESKIELLEGTSDESVISRYVKKRGEGIHHIAYAVKDIEKAVDRLKEMDFRVLGEIREGADNKLVAFLHPKDTSGVLTELCMDRPE